MVVTRFARPGDLDQILDLYRILNPDDIEVDAGRNLGRACIMKAIEFARENGCYKVMLLSGAERTEAHRFYESLGFSGTGKKGFVMRLPLCGK